MMFGTLIILLLACGGIVGQGSRGIYLPVRKNIFTRRNMDENFNSNTNIVFGGGQKCKEDSREPISTLDNVRRKLNDEKEARRLADSITKTLIQNLSQTIAITVAESITKFLKFQTDFTEQRNNNTNIDTNFNNSSNVNNVMMNGSKKTDTTKF